MLSKLAIWAVDFMLFEVADYAIFYALDYAFGERIMPFMPL